MWASLTKGLSQLQQQAQESLPQLQQRVIEQVEQLGQQFAPWVPSLGGVPQEIVLVGDKRLRIVKKLGEGGYSFVYLAEKVETDVDCSGIMPAPSHRARYALKKVLCAGHQQLAEAQHEITVMQRFNHPNLLPLVGFSVVNASDTVGGASHIVYMLFPLYEMNAWDFVQTRRAAAHPLTPAEVAHIFSQMCAGLQAMHVEGLAHRDVKLHNILLKRGKPSENPSSPSSPSSAPAAAVPSLRPGDGAHLVANSVTSQVHNINTARSPKSNVTSKQHLSESSKAGGDGAESMQVVLMDFGSAGPALIDITRRSEALALQEDAERRCTAPYRAPELWDVPSSCVMGPGIDVWAAGCVLYTLMVGETPFERASNESGGSLMLAIVNGNFSWPEATLQRYPEEMLALVVECLAVEPGNRPDASTLVEKCALMLNALQK